MDRIGHAARRHDRRRRGVLVRICAEQDGAAGLRQFTRLREANERCKVMRAQVITPKRVKGSKLGLWLILLGVTLLVLGVIIDTVAELRRRKREDRFVDDLEEFARSAAKEVEGDPDHAT